MVICHVPGTGGSGAAAFVPMKSSSIGPPSGGNGGPGGSVYVSTSPHLTSLISVTKRLRGGKGLNGLGSYQHGRRGADLIVQVPVGTVIKEMGRSDEDGEIARNEVLEGLNEEEKDRRRRERLFIKHPTADISEDDYRNAERHLYREGRVLTARPDSMPPPTSTPIHIDIFKPLTEPILLSPGGQGGLGNPHFYNEQGRPPRLASRGLTPPTLTLSFELKLLADVGLVGFPNAGKSTILRALTGRKAEVAGYQFTTLNPQIGVVRVCSEGGEWKGGMREGQIVEETWKERQLEAEAREKETYWAPTEHLPRSSQSPELLRFTISDNPGLLPLASENYGLGHSFLRSIERSLALAYVLDLTRPNPGEDMMALRKELEAYKAGLSEKVRLVILNKEDGLEPFEIEEKAEGVRNTLEGLKEGQEHVVEVVQVSARRTQGLKEVVKVLGKAVQEARRSAASEQGEQVETAEESESSVEEDPEKEGEVQTLI